jgi:hypothetical protein
VKLPYWTPAIINTFKLIRKVSFSDQTVTKDKIIEELLRESPLKNRDSERFYLIYLKTFLIKIK